MRRYTEILQGKLLWLTDYVMLEPIMYYRHFYRPLDDFSEKLKKLESKLVTQELVNEAISAAFGNLIALYMSSSLSGVQFKGLADYLDNCRDFNELLKFIGSVGGMVKLIGSARGTEERKKYMKKVIGGPKGSMLTLNQRLAAKHMIEKSDERKTDSLYNLMNDKTLEYVVKSYMDTNKEYRARVPESKKMALTIEGCTDEIADEAACIADTPRYVWNFYVNDKLMSPLTRLIVHEEEMPEFLVNKDREMYNKAYIRTMLSEASMKKAVAADEIAKFLVECENAPLSIMEGFRSRMNELGVADIIPRIQDTIDKRVEERKKEEAKAYKDLEKEDKKIMKQVNKEVKEYLKNLKNDESGT